MDPGNHTDLTDVAPEDVAEDAVPDIRLYVPDSEGWQAQIKNDSEKV